MKWRIKAEVMVEILETAASHLKIAIDREAAMRSWDAFKPGQDTPNKDMIDWITAYLEGSERRP